MLLPGFSSLNVEDELSCPHLTVLLVAFSGVKTQPSWAPPLTTCAVLDQ